MRAGHLQGQTSIEERHREIGQESFVKVSSINPTRGWRADGMACMWDLASPGVQPDIC
jgi:hypothetical protein